MPVTMRARGPTRGSSTMLEMFEDSRMQAIIGRKASPLVTGL
jgi:predicted aconitase with swiveling domain